MRFRKKPVVIEAEQYFDGKEIDGILLSEDIMCSGNSEIGTTERCVSVRPYIDTLEGKMWVGEGDWIITGVKGERYPCKPDIFEATYEAIEP